MKEGKGLVNELWGLLEEVDGAGELKKSEGMIGETTEGRYAST
jgi:hypothetical protein